MTANLFSLTDSLYWARLTHAIHYCMFFGWQVMIAVPNKDLGEYTRVHAINVAIIRNHCFVT